MATKGTHICSSCRRASARISLFLRGVRPLLTLADLERMSSSSPPPPKRACDARLTILGTDGGHSGPRHESTWSTHPPFSRTHFVATSEALRKNSWTADPRRFSGMKWAPGVALPSVAVGGSRDTWIPTMRTWRLEERGIASCYELHPDPPPQIVVRAVHAAGQHHLRSSMGR
jgi:hypothetical protein